MQKLSIQNLRLRIRLLDFCDRYGALGNYPSHTLPDGRVEFALGDLISGEERIVCFAVEVLPVPCVDGAPVVSLEGEKLLEFDLLYDELTADQVVSRTFAQLVRIQATQDPGLVRQNGEVISWVSTQRVGRLIRDVTRHMDAGKPAEALKLLDQEENWLQKRNAPSDSDARRTIEALRDRIRAMDWSPRDRKEAHFQMDALMKMSSEHLWSSKSPAPKFKRQRTDRQSS